MTWWSTSHLIQAVHKLFILQSIETCISTLGVHVHVHVRCRKLTVVSLIMASFARLVLNSCWNAATIESYAIDSTLNLLLASTVVNNDCC